jgi:hypothetical protein
MGYTGFMCVVKHGLSKFFVSFFIWRSPFCPIHAYLHTICTGNKFMLNQLLVYPHVFGNQLQYRPLQLGLISCEAQNKAECYKPAWMAFHVLNQHSMYIEIRMSSPNRSFHQSNHSLDCQLCQQNLMKAITSFHEMFAFHWNIIANFRNY